MNSGKHYLKVAGHAGFSEYGDDIVCAAVSALVTGSAELWKHNQEVSIQKDVRQTFFEFKLTNPSPQTTQEFEFLKRHLYLLSKNYPKHISYIENIDS